MYLILKQFCCKPVIDLSNIPHHCICRTISKQFTARPHVFSDDAHTTAHKPLDPKKLLFYWLLHKLGCSKDNKHNIYNIHNMNGRVKSDILLYVSSDPIFMEKSGLSFKKHKTGAIYNLQIQTSKTWQTIYFKYASNSKCINVARKSDYISTIKYSS